jgi:hypothetical protein
VDLADKPILQIEKLESIHSCVMIQSKHPLQLENAAFREMARLRTMSIGIPKTKMIASEGGKWSKVMQQENIKYRIFDTTSTSHEND